MRNIVNLLILSSIVCLAACQSNSVTTTLQCNGGRREQDHVITPQSVVPGKRGAKGEKGDCSDVVQDEKFERLMEKLTSLNSRLTTTESKFEALENDKAESASRAISLELYAAGILKLSSCKDISTILNVRVNGTYKIQPGNSVQPFNVNCRFNGNTVITSISHDSENEIQVSDCDTEKCYHRNIHYDASMTQLRALIQLSTTQCRQYIKYRCRGSIISLGLWAGFESWDGELKRYWGGSGGVHRSCSCGVTGTCADTSKKCNCDKNDLVWREDSGYLSQEEDLPVTKLYFGDANLAGGEFGHHTLGQLECLET